MSPLCSALLLKYIYCKKRFSGFPSPAGMSLTKLSLAGNNLRSPSPRRVWSEQIQECCTFFLQCIVQVDIPSVIVQLDKMNCLLLIQCVLISPYPISSSFFSLCVRQLWLARLKTMPTGVKKRLFILVP